MAMFFNRGSAKSRGSASGILPPFRQSKLRNGNWKSFATSSRVFWALIASKMHLWSELHPVSSRGAYSAPPTAYLVDGVHCLLPKNPPPLLSAFDLKFRLTPRQICAHEFRQQSKLRQMISLNREGWKTLVGLYCVLRGVKILYVWDTDADWDKCFLQGR